jgi:hypothetical protein
MAAFSFQPSAFSFRSSAVSIRFSSLARSRQFRVILADVAIQGSSIWLLKADR